MAALQQSPEAGRKREWTMTATITIEISREAQAEELRAGRPGHATRSYDVPAKLLAETLDLGGQIDSAGNVTLNGNAFCAQLTADRHYQDPVLLAPKPNRLPADARAVVEIYRNAASTYLVARERAAIERETRAAKQRADEAAREDRRARGAVIAEKMVPGPQDFHFRVTVDGEEFIYQLTAEQSAQRASAVEAARVAALAPRTAWIAAHGSARLQRLLKEAIEHDAVFRDEYLVREYPGWKRYADVAWESKDTRNTSECGFVLLDAARVRCPDAHLQYWQHEGQAGYSAEAEITLPGASSTTLIVLTSDDATWDLPMPIRFTQNEKPARSWVWFLEKPKASGCLVRVVRVWAHSLRLRWAP